MSFSVELNQNQYHHRRYYLRNEDQHIHGKIVLEKYGDQWHLELMNTFPSRQGLGTILLQHVLKDMKCNLSVHAVTPESKSFFTKFGMKNDLIPYNGDK
jgi:hypothetical protein